MKIALATYEKYPNLTSHERELIPLFAKKGIEAKPVIWSDEDIDWATFDAVIIRSCWDYHKHVEEFDNWLNLLDQLGVPCWNPTHIIRQNTRKTYLKDLADQGVNVIPTEWLTKNDIGTLDKIMKSNGWEKAVIKPIVSATAYKTFVVNHNQIDEALVEINHNFADGEVFMLQQFLPQIYASGEWSLMFFNKEFSHAVLKMPKSGEFRVQEEYGGRATIQKAPDKLVVQARNILTHYREPLLYTRVDGLWIDETFYLMELELTEPELFLDDHHKRETFVRAFLYICRSIDT